MEREDLALAGAAEQLDLLLALVDDGLRAGSQQLAGVEALALLILASLDILAGSLSEDQLALGVDVDLGDAQADGLCDHLVGDAGAAVQDQGDVVSGLVDAVQSLEVQALPVGRVDTVDVADASCQEVDAQIGDLCALRRVCDLASAHDAVLDGHPHHSLRFLCSRSV